ncbi:MAG TPA: hypothetical protein VHM19_04185 [Polyangiales bacterium]|jgi:hypothetical protein|nr:hypothetical protein [Polyangiales bacterium]
MELRALWWGLLLGLSACVGGQSGTETGGGAKNVPDFGDTSIKTSAAPNSCACALSERPGAAARGFVISVDSERVRVRVTELLGEGPVQPEVRFAVGDEVAGSAPAMVCDGGPALHQGDDVAFVHVPSDAAGLACLEYQTCLADRCAQLQPGDVRAQTCDQDCKVRTRGACLSHAGEALLEGTMLVAPWSEQLQLPGETQPPGAALRVPRTELSSLLDGTACSELLQDQTGSSPGLGSGEGGEFTLHVE